MKFKFTNSAIEHNRTVFNVQPGSNLEVVFENTTIEHNGTFLNEQSTQSVIQTLGLPSDAPKDMIIECLSVLAQLPPTDAKAHEAAAKESRLMKWLAGSESFSTVFANLLSIATNETVHKVLAVISR